MSAGTGWRAFGRAAFDEAKAAGKSVFLVCAEPERFSDDHLKALESRCVPVRATTVERPDVALRYAKAPSLCSVLSASGDLLWVPESWEGAAILAEVQRRPATGAAPKASGKDEGPVWTGAVGAAKPPELDPGRPAALLGEIKSMPHLANFEALALLAHAAAEWGDAEAGRQAKDALKKLCLKAGPGSLQARAAWLLVYADAAAALDDAELRKYAAGLADELVREHFDPARGVFAAERALGSRVFADLNAAAALALFRASALAGSRKGVELGERALAYVERELYDPMLGVIHEKAQGGAPLVYGLLGDNARAALAFTEAYQLSGQRTYRDVADAVMRFLFQELWDRDRGGFVDRVPQRDDAGLLRETHRPAGENATALEALWRLRHMKGNKNYERWLDWGLKALSAGAEGASAATLARVQDIVQGGRMDLELVGRVGEAATDALLAEAHRHYAPRRIVSFVDPDDQDYILAHKLARKEEPQKFPRLFGCVDLRPVADAGDPSGVAAVIAAVRKR